MSLAFLRGRFRRMLRVWADCRRRAGLAYPRAGCLQVMLGAQTSKMSPLPALAALGFRGLKPLAPTNLSASSVYSISNDDHSGREILRVASLSHALTFVVFLDRSICTNSLLESEALAWQGRASRMSRPSAMRTASFSDLIPSDEQSVSKLG